MIITLAIDWGDVPTWLSAITTTGALIAAGIVVRVELRRDSRQLDAAERAEQADTVAVWHEGFPREGVVIHNGSTLPIYSVAVEFEQSDETLLYVAVNGPLPPGDHRIRYPGLVRENIGKVPMGVSFEDTAGRSWTRLPDGRLQRMPEGYGNVVAHNAELRTAVLPPQ